MRYMEYTQAIPLKVNFQSLSNIPKAAWTKLHAGSLQIHYDKYN